MGDSKGIQRVLRNPAFGLIYLLLFSFLTDLFDIRLTISALLILAITGRFFIQTQYRLVHTISAITFAIALPIFFFLFSKLSDTVTFIYVEVIFVLAIFSICTSDIYTRIFHGKKANPRIKIFVSESLSISRQTQYGLTIHLLLMVLYFTFISNNNPTTDRLVVTLTFQLIVIGVFTIEAIRLNILDRKLYKEEWLPVVTEQGYVTGRVAKSVTKELKNKYMHPIIRIALIHKGRIYLKEREQNRLLNPGLLDYPFEKYMQFNHKIDETAYNLINGECKTEKIPLRFLLKYIFENDITKRLVFLYVSEIEDEALFNKLHLTDGKLWTETQIEDNLGLNIFSECFESEFEYLKNTALMTSRLTSNNR